jgi:hypothetical protein
MSDRKEQASNMGLEHLWISCGLVLEGPAADLDRIIGYAEASENVRVIHVKRSLAHGRLYIVPENRLDEAFASAKEALIREILGKEKTRGNAFPV